MNFPISLPCATILMLQFYHEICGKFATCLIYSTIEMISLSRTPEEANHS